jgi:hypothetical protein
MTSPTVSNPPVASDSLKVSTPRLADSLMRWTLSLESRDVETQRLGEFFG